MGRVGSRSSIITRTLTERWGFFMSTDFTMLIREILFGKYYICHTIVMEDLHRREPSQNFNKKRFGYINKIVVYLCTQTKTILL
jgi:hypothetical protein